MLIPITSYAKKKRYVLADFPFIRSGSSFSLKCQPSPPPNPHAARTLSPAPPVGWRRGGGGGERLTFETSLS